MAFFAYQHILPQNDQSFAVDRDEENSVDHLSHSVNADEDHLTIITQQEKSLDHKCFHLVLNVYLYLKIMISYFFLYLRNC